MAKVITFRFGIQPKMVSVRAYNNYDAMVMAILLNDPFQSK